jgi:hypothetical protein
MTHSHVLIAAGKVVYQITYRAGKEFDKACAQQTPYGMRAILKRQSDLLNDPYTACNGTDPWP